MVNMLGSFKLETQSTGHYWKYVTLRSQNLKVVKPKSDHSMNFRYFMLGEIA
jgi:hypothetical protein